MVSSEIMVNREKLLTNKHVLIVGRETQLRKVITERLEEEAAIATILEKPPEDLDTLSSVDVIVNLTDSFQETKDLFRIAELWLSNNGSFINLVFNPEELASFFTEQSLRLASQSADIVVAGKFFARELGLKGIRVNSLLMGPVDTEEFYQLLPEEIDPEKISDVRTLPRIPTPDDIAKAVVFFASDLSSYVTGQAFPIADLQTGIYAVKD